MRALMPRLLLSIALLLVATSGWGAVYYVDNTSGSDANTGLATDNAWKTLNKVNTATSSGTPTWTDTFSDDDISDWTVTGTGVSASSEAVQVTFSGAAAAHMANFAFASATEVWSSHRVYVSSLTISAGSWIVGGGIGRTDLSTVLNVGWRQNGNYHITYRNDAGEQSVDSGDAYTTEEWVTITLYWKASTAPGANNGIGRVWVNGTLIWELTNIDSDAQTASAIFIGTRWSLGNSATLSFDDTSLYGDNPFTSLFAAGDSILLKRGEAWAETLTPNASGAEDNAITFGAYGTGAAPRITGGTKAIDTNGKNYLTFTGLDCDGKEVYVNASTGTTINYVVSRNSNANGFNVSNSPTTALNNVIAAGAASNGVLGAGATTVVTLTNSMVSGNGIVGGGGYGIDATGGASVTYTNSLVTGNNYWATNNISATPTDGGNNLVESLSGITAYINGNAPVVISSDDDDVAYWNLLAAAFAPYGAKLTAFMTTANITAGEEDDIATLAAAGHEMAVHGWSHNDLTKTTAFAVTSTNTNPQVTVDMTAKTIDLTCTNSDNNVSVDFSATDNTIANLKTAVTGKGWTITNTDSISNGLKLASLADSAGAQNAPYTVNLDVTEGNGYPFWREEIADAATWIESKAGVAPTTMAYPYGANSAGLQAYLQAVAGLAGARGYANSLARLNSVNVYNINVVSLASGGLLGDGSEAVIRQRTRHYYELCKHVGGIFAINSHSASDFSVDQMTWLVDELYNAGATFKTFGEAVAEIVAGHATADNITYTKTYTDASDFSLVSSSVAINAGVAIDGLTTDYLGNPIVGLPDVGAYEYQGEEEDTTPDAFSFTDVTDAALSTEYTSDAITVAGIDNTAVISITVGTYSINGGAYSSDNSVVSLNDNVTVRGTSSGEFSTAVEVVLTIGGVSDTYSITTLAEDSTPEAFVFTDVTDATISTVYTSNAITVEGINTTVAISITGGTYSKNGAAYTADPGTVVVGDNVSVRVTSSGSFETAVDAELDIGGVTDTYSVTTEVEDGTPAAFSFTDKTNAALETDYTSSIVVAGINTTVAIGIVGGTYSINGGAYTADAGTVEAGDTVTVKGTSSTEIETVVNVVVNIGGIEDTFTITTGDGTTGTNRFPSFLNFPSFPSFGR